MSVWQSGKFFTKLLWFTLRLPHFFGIYWYRLWEVFNLTSVRECCKQYEWSFYSRVLWYAHSSLMLHHPTNGVESESYKRSFVIVHFLKFRLTGFQLSEFDCNYTVCWQNQYYDNCYQWYQWYLHTQIQLISLNQNPVNRNFRKWVGCEALALGVWLLFLNNFTE